ncbi:AEC family transporter [Stappia sp. 28M-7]|jgi:predicted permease|uniref:AEC family transporter n=1 Tax=Stappia sp. 28M-7 TaxID=2762596 RepID=UPI000E75BAAD|nr:AEC family transporter [Stappia sp. 28M-7]MBC2859403.1 AEC family transporter [Stappia sp. 28M-7]
MENVISLALPFFGLIFLGVGAGKLKDIPASGLAWMQFFIIYIALPALFFRLLAKTPIEELTNIGYVAATTFATYSAFAIAFCVGVLASRGNIPEATIQALAGSYSNVGYMGPGLTLAVLGPAAAVPTALVFCFDNILLFTLTPLMMAIGGTDNEPPLKTMITVVKRIFTHPFILATIAGVLAAAVEFQPPQAIDTLLTFLSNAAAPCALFAMGVTVAQQPMGRVPLELPVILAVKLIVHPLIVLMLLNWMGGVEPAWVATAVLMACLPPAANVFVIAQQYHVYIQRASSSILIGTIASTVTVSIFIYLITEGLLPLQ